jgi:hypothetical protein
LTACWHFPAQPGVDSIIGLLWSWERCLCIQDKNFVCFW